MLDLGFVRDNLPMISEKLRQRGLDADALLGGFADIDAKRRHAITAIHGRAYVVSRARWNTLRDREGIGARPDRGSH